MTPWKSLDSEPVRPSIAVGAPVPGLVPVIAEVEQVVEGAVLEHQHEDVAYAGVARVRLEVSSASLGG